MSHEKQHGLTSAEDHAPGTDGTLVGTESGTVVGKPFSPSAVGNAIVQRRGTGHIDLPLTPTLDEQAASKKYVDDHSGSGITLLLLLTTEGGIIYSNDGDLVIKAAA